MQCTYCDKVGTRRLSLGIGELAGLEVGNRESRRSGGCEGSWELVFKIELRILLLTVIEPRGRLWGKLSRGSISNRGSPYGD